MTGSARGFVDDAPIEFGCPKCGRTVKATVGDGRRNRSISCPGGHTITVDGSQLDRTIRDVERKLENITRRFG